MDLNEKLKEARERHGKPFLNDVAIPGPSLKAAYRLQLQLIRKGSKCLVSKPLSKTLK